MLFNFLSKKYQVIKPRYHNYGGFYNSLFYGIYISLKTKKKFLILMYPLDFFYKKKEFYGTNLVISLLLKHSLKCFILSIFISVIYNLVYVISLIFRKIIYVPLITKHDKIFSWGSENINQINRIVIDKKIYTDLYKEFSKEITKKSHNNPNIVLCVKDTGFSKKKDISVNYTAEIQNYEKTLKYINSKNIFVSRIGEPLMKKFDYVNPFYEDLTRKKNYFYLSDYAFRNSDFYIGTGASHLALSRLYNKPSITSNSVAFLRLGLFDKKSSIIFKKFYSLKDKKILKFEEIFSKISLCYEIEFGKENLERQGYILEDNTSDEIYNQFKDFYDKKIYKKNIPDSKLLKEFKSMRNHYIKKHITKIEINNFECMICNDFYIPDFYLENMIS